MWAALDKDHNVFNRSPPHSLGFKALLQDPHNKELNNQAFYVLFFHGFQLPRVLIEDVGTQQVLFRFLTPEDFSELFGSDFLLVLFTYLHQADNYHRLTGPICLNDTNSFPAIIAHTLALSLIKLFSQKVQLHFPTAEVGFLAIVEYRIQTVNVLILSRTTGALISDNKEVIAFTVWVWIVEDTFCALLISSGSATFLNITFQRFRHRVVNNKPDIFFVDSHSKCDCCNYDLNLISHPSVLYLLPLNIRKLSMIKIAFHLIVPLQNFSKFFAFFSWYAVYNSWLTTEPSPQHLH